MRLPNPIKPVNQQIQQFAQRVSQPQPPILSGGPGQQPSAEQQVHELALEIYARAAADFLDGADDDRLRTLATSSQRAARAFFESMGVQCDA